MADENFYDNGIYVIEPEDHITILEQFSGYGSNQHHHGHEVSNIGRTEVHVAFKHGTAEIWHGNICDDTVEPGFKKAFPSNNRYYCCTALVVTNRTTKRAIISANFLNQRGPNNYDLEFTDLFTKGIYRAVSRIVSVTKKKALPIEQGISVLLETFWPEKNNCIWMQIYKIIDSIIKNKMVSTCVKKTNIPDLNHLKERFEGFLEHLENGDLSIISTKFISIAEDLEDYEDMFVYKSPTPQFADLNFALLPLYSQVVFMKLSFYAIGISKANEYGLQPNQVQELKRKAHLTLFKEDGAVSYIINLSQTLDELIYATADPKVLYNSVSGVRSYTAVCGLQYIPVWKGILLNSVQEPYNDVIVYSPLFGKQTAALAEECLRYFPRQPITPKLTANGLRNVVRHIFVYLDKTPNEEENIRGIEMCFMNGDTYFMGGYPSEKNYLDFYDCKLLKLAVAGFYEVNYMRFHFSDSRVVEFGHAPDYARGHIFELAGHHIVSIFVSSDFWESGKDLDNVAVAYQLTTDESHSK